MNEALEKYTNNYLNFNNIKSSFTSLKLYNDQIENAAAATEDDSAVNYRKTYYEQQAIETASYVYILCLIIYGIAAFVCLITLLRNPEVGKVKLFLAALGMVLFPYFSVTISLWIMKMWKKLMDLLPTNVYRNL